jgi:hypothetical protein
MNIGPERLGLDAMPPGFGKIKSARLSPQQKGAGLNLPPTISQ